MRSYLRFAALGDSTTFGMGDPVPGGWRGWARMLADAISTGHDVSFCNVAASGATTSVVLESQLEPALAHRADIASLVVGVNDTMRSTWDPARLREDLFTCAHALHASGATLLTARFHDHGAVLGLPGILRRPLWRRIEAVNAAYDDIHRAYGGIRIDLAHRPEVAVREFWSIDRLHPSELGHRRLAHEFGLLLNAAGLGFAPTSLDRSGGQTPTRWSDLWWMVSEGAPWVGRRARDLGPWAAHLALTELVAATRPSVVSRP